MSASYRSPDGRWRVDVITIELAPELGGESGRGSAGDGEQFRVKRDGFYYCSARTMAELNILIGPAVVRGLEEAR